MKEMPHRQMELARQAVAREIAKRVPHQLLERVRAAREKFEEAKHQYRLEVEEVVSEVRI